MKSRKYSIEATDPGQAKIGNAGEGAVGPRRRWPGSSRFPFRSDPRGPRCNGRRHVGPERRGARDARGAQVASGIRKCGSSSPMGTRICPAGGVMSERAAASRRRHHPRDRGAIPTAYNRKHRSGPSGVAPMAGMMATGLAAGGTMTHTQGAFGFPRTCVRKPVNVENIAGMVSKQRGRGLQIQHCPLQPRNAANEYSEPERSRDRQPSRPPPRRSRARARSESGIRPLKAAPPAQSLTERCHQSDFPPANAIPAPAELTSRSV